MKVQQVVIILPERTIREWVVAKDNAPVVSNKNWVNKWHEFRSDKFGLKIKNETSPGLTESECLDYIRALGNGDFIM